MLFRGVLSLRSAPRDKPASKKPHENELQDDADIVVNLGGGVDAAAKKYGKDVAGYGQHEQSPGHCATANLPPVGVDGGTRGRTGDCRDGCFNS